MSEPQAEPRELQLGFDGRTGVHVFACVGHLWIALMQWSSAGTRARSYVSEYGGGVAEYALRRQMGELGKLSISSVRMYPTRFTRLSQMESPHVPWDDMKGGKNDANPWFFRTAIPPVEFYSCLLRAEGGGIWQTRFGVQFSGTDALTPTQKTWISEKIVPGLDRCFTTEDRTMFLERARARACSRFKDDIMMDAMKQMAYLRKLAEWIETNDLNLIP